MTTVIEVVHGSTDALPLTFDMPAAVPSQVAVAAIGSDSDDASWVTPVTVSTGVYGAPLTGLAVGRYKVLVKFPDGTVVKLDNEILVSDRV